jgi:hypothetical protein
MIHSCNASFLGGKRQEDHTLRPALGRSWRLYDKNKEKKKKKMKQQQQQHE